LKLQRLSTERLRDGGQCYPFRIMRIHLLLTLSFCAALYGAAQTASTTPAALPKDPHEIFATAAPYYDFSDPSLTPWHLKAAYQFYDDQGKPAEQGTFEY
jgi:hypothetical protein